LSTLAYFDETQHTKLILHEYYRLWVSFTLLKRLSKFLRALNWKKILGKII